MIYALNLSLESLSEAIHWRKSWMLRFGFIMTRRNQSIDEGQKTNKMKTKFTTLIKTITALVFLVFSSPSLAFQLDNLTILAEPNMIVALTKISRIYSQKNGIIISVSFAPSSELINDIEAGEPSDVFISAHRYWIDNLKQKGLVDIYNIDHIADDSLVLVTSQKNITIPQELTAQDLSLMKALEILNQNGANLIVDDEGSSLGQYSQNLLGAMDTTNLKIFRKLPEDKTPISKTLDNEAQSYSILLSSQLVGHSEFKVLSSLKNQHIFYQALVIAGDNMEVARKFLRFLRSKEAKKIFKESGFIVEE